MALLTNNSSPLHFFVDTDAFVALAKEDDPSHHRALTIASLLEQQNVRYVTSNYVFSETVTVISQRLNHNTSLQFIENIRSATSPFPITWITPELEEKALRIFERQTSKNVSFVDCTNMAVLDHLRLDGIFSFDKAYRTNGYTLIEDLLQKPSSR